MKIRITKIFNKMYHYADDALILVTDEDDAFTKSEFERFCNSNELAIKTMSSDMWNDDNDRFIHMTRFDFIKIVSWIMKANNNTAESIRFDSFIYNKRPVRCPVYYKTYDANGDEVTNETKLIKDLTVSELAVSEHETYGNSDKLMPHITIYDRESRSSIYWLSLSKDQYEEFKKLRHEDIIYSDLVGGSLVVYKWDIDYISVYDIHDDIPEEIPFD